MAKPRQSGSARTKTAGPPPQRPQLAESGGRFLQLERETEQEFGPQLLQALQDKVNRFQDPALEVAPSCPACGKAMGHHDSRRVWWLTRFGRIQAVARRYRCRPCQQSRRPLLEVLGVEPGRTGSHQRFAGAAFSGAGRGRAVSAGGAIGGAAVGSQGQHDGCVASDATVGRGSGAL